MLDLVNPVGPRGRTVGRGWEAGLDEFGVGGNRTTHLQFLILGISMPLLSYFSTSSFHVLAPRLSGLPDRYAALGAAGNHFASRVADPRMREMSVSVHEARHC